MPKRDRQAEIDAMFEKALHQKPRDENFKPALASGEYIGSRNNGTLFMVVNDEYRPWTTSTGTITSIHDSFDKLNAVLASTTLTMKEMGAQVEKLGKWTDGA